MPEKVVQDGSVFHTFFEKPEELSTLQKIGKFLYDPKKKAILTRTPLSWAKIFLFYCIFYSALACLFSGCVYMLLRSLDPIAPRWQLDESRIGSNPGLGFRPANTKESLGYTLLTVNTKFGTQNVLIEQLDRFLKPYQEALGPQYEVCDYARAPVNRSATSCSLDVSEWEPCTSRSGYGYNAASPCVFLKLNKIFAWEPEFYKNDTELPEDMPEDLQEYIRTLEEPEKLRTIWLSCTGETTADQQHLGPVQYIPERGFPGYYYPFINTKGYLSPLVAVHFQRPAAGVIVSVECKAWAKNIAHNRRDKVGSVMFQIFVE